jgi:katanin p80 WD40 repeat-containing subunit B1
LEFNP